MTVITSMPTVQVRTHGRVSQAQVEHATDKLRALLRYSHEPVLFARIKLTQLPDPALARPFVVQVNLDVDGRLVRAQVAGESMRTAVDEVFDRLRDRLRRVADGWEDIRGTRQLTVAHEWRHGGVPSDRPVYFPRPVEEREVIRRKSFTLGRLTVDEAAVEMQALDYSFHLFTEAGTGTPSVLFRPAGQPCLRLVQLEPRPGEVEPSHLPLTVSPRRPSTLTLSDALALLDLSRWPFVFYRDAASGQARVAYHRYDGHYGLIEPAA